MSNREIRELIKDENITPILNETAMVKYFTYGEDSWIGYDDDETYAMKQALYVFYRIIMCQYEQIANHFQQSAPMTVALVAS